MKKEKKQKSKKKETTGKIDRFNIVFVDIQVIITVMTLIIGILVIFGKVSLNMFKLSLGVNLIVIAFNNYKIYKRSKLSLVYGIVGIILLLSLGV